MDGSSLWFVVKCLLLQKWKKLMIHHYFDLDLLRFSAKKEAVHLDNQLILFDNLDGGGADDEGEFVGFPIKLAFTVVVCCVHGSMKCQINLHELQLQAGDLLVCLPGTIGEVKGIDKDYRIALIAFGQDYFDGTYLTEASIQLKQMFLSSPVCHYEKTSMREFLTIYRLMKLKMEEVDNPYKRGALLGYASVLTANGYRDLLKANNKSNNPQKTTDRQQQIFKQFIMEVRRHFIDHRDTRFYAALLCVTPKYLSQVIHNVSGRFAKDWIDDHVLLEAKAMLMSRRYTVQEVASNLHFPSQSFFGKFFKRMVGMSPNKYVKTHTRHKHLRAKIKTA